MHAALTAGMAVQAFTRVYEYQLKVTGLWEEILSNCSFANFILFNCEDYVVRKQWLDFYEKCIKAFSYWLFIPATFVLSYEKVKRDKDLYAFFTQFEEWRKLEEYKTNNELKYTSDDKEASNQISNFFSFLLKIPPMLIGTFKSWAIDALVSGSYAIINLFKKNNWQVNETIEEILQKYRKAGIVIQYTILYPQKWYEFRPTYDFDIIVLFAHIKALSCYKELFRQDIEKQINNTFRKNIYAYLKVDNEIIMSIKPDNLNRINFCLSKEMIEVLKGDYAEIELGGAKKEGLLG